MKEFEFDTESADKLSDFSIERAVLATLLNKPALIYQIITSITKDDFYSRHNKALFESICSTISDVGDDIALDPALLLIRTNLTDYKSDKEFIDYVEAVRASLYSVDSLDSYSKRLTSLTIRRKMLVELDRIRDDVLGDAESEGSELISRSEQRLLDLQLKSQGLEEMVLLGTDANKYLETVRSKPQGMVGIETGFHKIDAILDGLQRKRLYVIQGERKVGKTAILQNIGLGIAGLSRVPVLMISTEMFNEEMQMRALSKLTGVQSSEICRMLQEEVFYNKMLSACQELESFPFYHVRMPAYTLDKIRAVVTRFVKGIVGEENGKAKDCLVIFDYIKLPDISVGQALEKEHQILGHVTTKLKDLAGDLDIPILTAAQTNQMGGIASSYRITWFCDVLMEIKNLTEEERKKCMEIGRPCAGLVRFRI